MGVLFHLYLSAIRWFMGVLEDHDCKSTLFRLIFGLEVLSKCEKGVFWNTLMV